MTQERTLIATTPLAGVRPLAWQGIQAITCYAQLVSLLETRLSAAHAAFLAEPQIDPMAHTADWYSAQKGTVQPLSSLPLADQVTVRQEISRLAASIQTLANELKNAADSNSKMAGSLLELALTYPSEDHLYRIGTQPVLVCWGCSAANAVATPEPLTRLASFTPPAAPPPKPEEPKPVHSPAVTAPVEVGQPQTAPVSSAPATEKKSSFPWWILFFLLGFLLCALIMPWLLPRLGLPSIRLDFLPGSCAMESTPPAPPPLPPAQKEALDGLGSSQDKEKALRDELNRLRLTFAERLAACPPKEAKIEPPPKVEPPKVEPPKAEPPKEPEPEVATLPVPQAKPEPPKEPEPVEKPREQPRNLKIPDKPTDMAFLEGCWLAEVGKLVNTTTGLPISVKFCFDKRGRGEVLIQEFDEQKRKVSECRGAATGRLLDATTLLIDDGGSIRCPDGSDYTRHEVFCENKGDIAVCNRPIPPPGTWTNVPFTRTTR